MIQWRFGGVIKIKDFPFFVFGLIVWIAISFICLPTVLSVSSPVLGIDLSKEGFKTLPCVWINGKTLMPNPPEPLNQLKIMMNIPRQKSTFQLQQPNAFDPFYIDRIISKDTLMNTMFPYKEDKSAPVALTNNKIIDQFSNEEFLYYTNQAGTNSDETYGSYFRVNPYELESKLIWTMRENNSPKNPTYAGYLSATSQYCFISGKRLLLYNPDNGKVTNEAYFPNLTSFYNSDLYDLFIFEDTEQRLNAYSIQKHAIIWQNPNLLKDSYRNIGLLQPVSFSRKWILAADYNRQRFVSLLDGNLLADFDLHLENSDFTSSYQEINNALWLQYYKKQEYYEHITEIRFEKISYSLEKGISISLYKLDNLIVDPINKVKLDDLISVCYSYLPRQNKVLIVFKNLDGLETQAIFELP